MSKTAHKNLLETKEFFDPPDLLEKKIQLLAEWIKKSNHTIAFTGAGISTSTGIPDFRSGLDTSLNTGPGIWTLKSAIENGKVKGSTKDLKNHVDQMNKAIPSLSHMSLVGLYREKLLHYVISQNTDGLHRRSGIPPNIIAELHGNYHLEHCLKCHREYFRDYDVRDRLNPPTVHYTGRRCQYCNIELQDTIINFTEPLPTHILDESFAQARRADLCLAMGSSLRVVPACRIPLIVAQNKPSKLVIINLQLTPLDSECQLKIHAHCDIVLKRLMEILSISIPPFQLTRYIQIKTSIIQENKHECLSDWECQQCTYNNGHCRTHCEMCDKERIDDIQTLKYIYLEVLPQEVDGTASSILKTVIFQVPRSLGPNCNVTNDPYGIKCPQPSIPWEHVLKDPNPYFNIKLSFFGYFNEPDYTITYPLPIVFVYPTITLCTLMFQPPANNWQCNFSPPLPAAKECAICRKSSAFKCSQCKFVYYCSRDHQINHWKNHHKQYCKAYCDDIKQ